MKNDENLFWVSLQSNLLTDLSSVENDFENAVKEMKEEMKRNGWILPALKANMRNQVNIVNVQVEKSYGGFEMQSSIIKLPSGTSLIGEVPLLFNVKRVEWNVKKNKVLKHCLELMSQKSERNIAVLWDEEIYFDKVVKDIKNEIKDRIVVSYPNKQCKEEGISNVKQFVEKSGHILVTQYAYFNGCECPNVLILTSGNAGGVRNCVLRGVQNLICVQLIHGMGSNNERNERRQQIFMKLKVRKNDMRVIM